MEFFKYIAAIRKYIEENEPDTREVYALCSSILFNLKQQESETNSNYAQAFSLIVDAVGISKIDGIDFEAWFEEIMDDENDHAAKFNAMASALLGLKVGSTDS